MLTFLLNLTSTSSLGTSYGGGAHAAPSPEHRVVAGADYDPNGLLYLALLLLIAPPIIGWVAGRLVGGSLGKVIGAAVPAVGWGVYLVRAFSAPSDYGTNGTIGGPVTLIMCSIAGGLGWVSARAFNRRRAGSLPEARNGGGDAI